MPVSQEHIDDIWPQGAPGSEKAATAGCTCPVIDNAKGLGMIALGHDWWITMGCPVHDPR